MRHITGILLMLTAAIVASCSSDSTITDVEDYVEQEPIRFSTTGSGNTAISRASELLEAGFVVSTYKLYGNATAQQTVMDRYEALYEVAGSYPGYTSKWNTVGTAGTDPENSLYQTQYERYWDLSAFPYRFHAITPCPKTADNSNIIKGFELSDQELSIPGNYEDPEGTYKYITYQSQSVSDGVVSPSYVEDPYMIAQVERIYDAQNNTYRDWDLLQPKFTANGDIDSRKTEIGSGSATRQVPLRFHHINSKVRFGIYTTVTNFPAEALNIQNVKITAKNATTQWQQFITKAAHYSASINGVTDKDNFFDKGSYVNQNGADVATLIDNPSKTADLKDATSRDKAYFFDIPSTKVGEKADGTPIYDDITTESGTVTPGGLLQIPQKGVELFVEFDINNEHYSFQLEVNGKKTFDWRASCRYTYYIVVTHLVPFEIAMTATIEPWVTVQSDDIGTDLEQ